MPSRELWLSSRLAAEVWTPSPSERHGRWRIRRTTEGFSNERPWHPSPSCFRCGRCQNFLQMLFCDKRGESLPWTAAGHGIRILNTGYSDIMYSRADGTDYTYRAAPAPDPTLTWVATFRNMAQTSSLSSPQTRKKWRYTCSRMPRFASSWSPPPRWWCRWCTHVKTRLFLLIICQTKSVTYYAYPKRPWFKASRCVSKFSAWACGHVFTPSW